MSRLKLAQLFMGVVPYARRTVECGIVAIVCTLTTVNNCQVFVFADDRALLNVDCRIIYGGLNYADKRCAVVDI